MSCRSSKAQRHTSSSDHDVFCQVTRVPQVHVILLTHSISWMDRPQLLSILLLLLLPIHIQSNTSNNLYTHLHRFKLTQYHIPLQNNGVETTADLSFVIPSDLKAMHMTHEEMIRFQSGKQLIHPQPQHPNVKIFALGFSKTGTTTLKLELEFNLNVKCCHWRCDDRQEWAKYTTKSEFDQYACFLDPGNVAIDYKKLHAWYPNAVFLMNVRKIRPWVTSMYRHIRGNRLASNCTPRGTNDDCVWHQTDAASLEWRANDRLDLKVKSFMMYYKQALDYFQHSSGHPLYVLKLEEYATQWSTVLSLALGLPFQTRNVSFSYSRMKGFPLTQDCIQEGINVYNVVCTLLERRENYYVDMC